MRKEHDENQYEYESDSFKGIIDKLFVDLWNFYKIDKEILKELFYNRGSELNQVKSFFENNTSLGENLILVGNAGIGKSNFIYRIISDNNILKDYKIHPIFIDLNGKNELNEFDEYIFDGFIESWIQYFKMVDFKITFSDNSKK